MFDIEFLKKNKITFPLVLCACDEVGRGPLAGPVVAACVKVEVQNEAALSLILKRLKNLEVTDSKKLKAPQRQLILNQLSIDPQNISAKKAYDVNHNGIRFSFSLEEIDNYEIDRINILQASLLAMKNCFLILAKNVESVVFIDGNKKFTTTENTQLFPIIKGDAQSYLIGLASIIAKEYRDLLMLNFSRAFPEYGFSRNMGYPSKKHLEVLRQHGPTPIHRLTFKGVVLKGE
jgi:ribonuclease HII